MIVYGSNRPSSFEIPAMLVDHGHHPPPHPLLRMPYARMGSCQALEAIPAAMHFAGFDMDSIQSQRLRLINTSGRPVKVHIIRPTTSFFRISCKEQGHVVMGLSTEVLVTFKPDEPRYYHDSIRVLFGDGPQQLLVPLLAYPAARQLICPTSIDFGQVPPGRSLTRVLPLHSHEGADFSFCVLICKAHPDFTCEPLAGIIPAHGKVCALQRRLFNVSC
jgi:hypothetical protein